MSPAPQANRPQYAGSAGPVPDIVDSSTAEWSRGYDPNLGAITGAEPTEVRASLVSVTPNADLAAAGGGAIALVGDNLGGSTGATIGGTAVTSFVVVDETNATAVTPAKAAGAHAVLVQNPAGNSVEVVNVTFV